MRCSTQVVEWACKSRRHYPTPVYFLADSISQMVSVLKKQEAYLKVLIELTVGHK